MGGLGIIGNISIDTACYPEGRRHELLGGAALHIARAAQVAGIKASPISVIGDDLDHDPRLAFLDLTHVRTRAGPSCRFRLDYDAADQVIGVDSDYGVAVALTEHALSVLQEEGFDRWHVCCRRLLDAGPILARLVAAEATFSVDFHVASATQQMKATWQTLPAADMVFVNSAEYTVLASLIEPETLKTVVVSAGPGEVRLFHHGELVATASPPAVAVAEATSAGDTLTGTFLALKGLPSHEALILAVHAASRQVGRALSG